MEKKKMGRPTDNPRNKQITFRLSEEELKKLNECSEKLEKSRTDILILGLEKIYKTLK